MRNEKITIAVPSWFTEEEGALVARSRVMMRNWSNLRKLQHFCAFNDGEDLASRVALQAAYAHTLSAYSGSGMSYADGLTALLKIHLTTIFNSFCLNESRRRFKQSWELDLLTRNLLDPSAASTPIKDAAFVLHANWAVYADWREINLGNLMADFMEEYIERNLERQDELDSGIRTWEEVAAIYPTPKY